MQGGIKIAGLSPVIIPVFISNMGCPHRCVFCDQSQFSAPVPPGEVPVIVDDFLKKCRMPQERNRILAFYGGSFTGIGAELLDEYLEVTSKLIFEKRIHGAKASTRPDMVSHSILKNLEEAGFVELELGIQSMDDRVLASSGRGHTASDAAHACLLVKKSGLRLGVQIMPGLPGEDIKGFQRTVHAVVECKPDSARIYPVVVLSGTKLEESYLQGEYKPLSLQEATSRTLYASVLLESQGCTMLRMGLPDSPNLRVTAGPYHPSFGFLVRSLGYRIMAGHMMDKLGEGCELIVNPRDIPELLGFRRDTILNLRFTYSFDETLPRGYIKGRSVRESACIQLQDILEYIL
jgi:histone acetyltransferase (RNA polymerase elongator complex component)